MTTEVIVKAHCPANKEVHIRIENDPGAPPHFFSKILPLTKKVYVSILI